jgi:hypothetical protein
MKARIVRGNFKAKPTAYNGRTYDSKAEARYAAQLDLRKRAGEVVMWLPQVPIPLVGGTRYVVDFVVFLADETVHFIDVKGVETPEFRLKKRQVEALYPIEVEVVR